MKLHYYNIAISIDLWGKMEVGKAETLPLPDTN